MQVQDDVVGLAWKPKAQLDKNKFYVYTKSGLIEEKTYIERDQFIMEMSARGTICMSSKERKTLHTIPFFDSNINYDMMNKRHF